jgi:MoaA/NifB/PqqE/SkfB family radical SAM enzyme
MKNLTVYSEYCQRGNRDFQLVACAMRENYHELPSIYELAIRLKARVSLNMVAYPAQHSLYTLPREERLSIRAQLEAGYHNLEPDLSPANRISFRGLLQRLGAEESWKTG